MPVGKVKNILTQTALTLKTQQRKHMLSNVHLSKYFNDLITQRKML
jgi:hypothetical protein